MSYLMIYELLGVIANYNEGNVRYKWKKLAASLEILFLSDGDCNCSKYGSYPLMRYNIEFKF